MVESETINCNMGLVVQVEVDMRWVPRREAQEGEIGLQRWVLILRGVRRSLEGRCGEFRARVRTLSQPLK